jgi:hypothetical protein
MTHPEISPDQAVNVLRILGEWGKRGLGYLTSMRLSHGREIFIVDLDDPSHPIPGSELRSEGSSPFDALCQATTVMQVLLEEYPEEAKWLATARASWAKYVASREPQAP